MSKITGWVTTARFAKKIGFIHISDGIRFSTDQVIIPLDILAQVKDMGIGIGTAIEVHGEWKDSPGSEQDKELVATSVKVIGECEASKYPIQKKDATLEYLRSIPHLRVKTKTFQSVFRVRSEISHAIHKFFHQEGYSWVHTPIITGSDCEGAGEMFQVRTSAPPPLCGCEPEEEHFFGQEVGLTVSGQLEVEAFAMSLRKVYTFGPTFRAEDSHTSRHASEFWMVEPEVAFAEMEDVMELAENFIKYVVRHAHTHVHQEVEHLREIRGLDVHGLKLMLEKPFARVTHDEAQDILVGSGEVFELPVGRGESLQSEHEKYLCKHFEGPVFVTDYPRLQKAFYMKVSEDRETVRAFDLLVPGIGEIIGGSQREDDLDTLIMEMRERGIPLEGLDWYLDLRRYGTVPHGGFGLGLERLIMWVTGVQNIRDVIPYPRVPGRAY